MNILKRVFKDYNTKELKKINIIINKIEGLDIAMQQLSDDELKQKTNEFKERLKNKENLDDILPEAFAVVREASFRTLGLKHYKEQLIGGIVIHQGRIAEMRTGEGKTLVSTLPAYLNSLTGKGVHIITVNDYLAKRDKEYAEKLYNFLGISVGVVIHGLSSEERKIAYNADITYGTNHEYGFDYLKDNMVMSKHDKVQRGLNFVIIDEVDSILIDEARTPLIISGKGKKTKELYNVADIFAKSLKKDIDFTIDEKTRSVMLTNDGINKVEKFFKIDNYADLHNIKIQHNVVQALKANYIMQKNIDYMLKNGEVLIVDEFTGRSMEGRRFSDGLHQAIEAKEGVEINKESITLASITFQNYFRMYNKIAGMTGTAKTEEEEFREIYALDVITIPTHKPIERIDYDDEVYKTNSAKLNAIVNDIIDTHKIGQPILVGTVSIEKSEELSKRLQKKGIPHKVLNAKYHEKEAEIISHAGERNAITIATNMAGRGTDIQLGEGVKELGGLKIIGTERHESRRIDNQLRGRAGRQGDVGVSKFYISLEDDLMRIFGSDRLKNIANSFDEIKPLKNKIVNKSIEKAQKNIEGNNFNARKSVLQYDDVLNIQRTVIYEQRNAVLEGKDIFDQIKAMMEDVISTLVMEHLKNSEDEIELEKALKDLVIDINKQFIHNDKIITYDDIKTLSNEEIINKCLETLLALYLKKEEQLTSKNMREIERLILLKVVDGYWIEHLDNMEHLRQGIGLRAYRQKDPVQEYQIEGSAIFDEMVYNIKLNTIKYLLNLQ